MSTDQREKLADKEPPVKNMVQYLRNISSGFEKGQLFYTACELDIFTLLRYPKSANEVSECLNTIPAITEKLLDALVSLGLLEFKENTYMTEKSVLKFLAKDEPYYARYLLSSLERRECWMNIGKIVKNGTISKPKKNEFKIEKNFVDYIARYSMLGRLQSTVKIISSRPEFKGARKVLDLGGCHGLFAIALAQEKNDIEAKIFDRPGITDFTEEYIRSYEMQERVKTITGDYLKDDIGAGYDIVLGLCSIGGEREQVELLYNKISDSLNEGGLFILSDYTLNDDGKGPLQTILWDIEGLLMGGNYLRLKNKDLSERLSKHGLYVENIVDMYGIIDVPMRLIIAKKNSQQYP